MLIGFKHIPGCHKREPGIYLMWTWIVFLLHDGQALFRLCLYGCHIGWGDCCFTSVFLVVPVINGGLVFTGVATYQQLVALVAETHIIGKYPAFVAHILNEYHFMVLKHLFLFGGDFGPP